MGHRRTRRSPSAGMVRSGLWPPGQGPRLPWGCAGPELLTHCKWCDPSSPVQLPQGTPRPKAPTVDPQTLLPRPCWESHTWAPGPLPRSMSVKPSAVMASAVFLSMFSRHRLASCGSSKSRAWQETSMGAWGGHQHPALGKSPMRSWLKCSPDRTGLPERGQEPPGSQPPGQPCRGPRDPRVTAEWGGRVGEFPLRTSEAKEGRKRCSGPCRQGLLL